MADLQTSVIANQKAIVSFPGEGSFEFTDLDHLGSCIEDWVSAGLDDFDLQFQTEFKTEIKLQPELQNEFYRI